MHFSVCISLRRLRSETPAQSGCLQQHLSPSLDAGRARSDRRPAGPVSLRAATERLLLSWFRGDLPASSAFLTTSLPNPHTATPLRISVSASAPSRRMPVTRTGGLLQEDLVVSKESVTTLISTRPHSKVRGLSGSHLGMGDTRFNPHWCAVRQGTEFHSASKQFRTVPARPLQALGSPSADAFQSTELSLHF